MAAPYSSSGGMDAWSQRRGLQTMNLRSVFTAEQQRILERYYDNGMTNQSKACFQLILQCAQEAKLDFSVVRTWVGNKRRKIASKVDQNGAMTYQLPSHGLPGGLLSSHSSGALPNITAGALLPSELAVVRSIQNRVNLLPPSSSFPSFSSSSSPSSSSPLSSGSNHNSNDVVLTGVYSHNSVPRPQPKPPAPPALTEQKPPSHPTSSGMNQALQGRHRTTSSPIHAKLMSLAPTLPSLTPASGPLVYTAVKKGSVPPGELGIGTPGVVPHSWTRQHTNSQAHSRSSSTQPQTRPQANTQPQLPVPQKAPVTLACQNTAPEKTPCIQRVYTLADKSETKDGDRLRQGLSSSHKSQENQKPVVQAVDPCSNFSIAIETADEDEWEREEELANMAAQSHKQKQVTLSSDPATVSGSPTPSVSKVAQGSYSLTTQTSLSRESSSQTTTVGLSAAPWVIINSRKRTLQDRTQFSDVDLIQLKRYWDRGMTSLGSVCREKITAAANQLNVDTEIVKTWISNRRRKYRLMGIEIPPPQGGPAVFTNSSPRNESPVTPEPRDEFNDEGSVCLSEDGTNDSHHRDEEDEPEAGNGAPMANNVKVEVFDEEDDYADVDGEGEVMASSLQQMHNLLEFKHEEVQFLEHELEIQKQKYLELASFTKCLLSAVRNNDLERQQELMASLPQMSDNWEMTMAREEEPFNHSDTCGDNDGDSERMSASKRLPPFPGKEDGSTSEATKPSASEEQLREAVH
ncbi:highly divergent homeobox [Synchiropus splendidus]|uniref:highly divergent homeobox n=1 Tax=Synchiropus splendidus TaxID=270530 RepID=UPI00237E0CB9|nr:highly divergent homeobox [Synchiropus splendidus]XP_053734936.1 highly divergent homeobox [Synchiropus splendidus]XP_053734937.1 highly divergent homeobox [Synchiropus splendidus]XP_053734938.1 highly divergent homeobox [Synchiropus splendidus]